MSDNQITIITHICPDGRYKSYVEGVPGAVAYGATSDEASAKVSKLFRECFSDDEFDHFKGKPNVQRFKNGKILAVIGIDQKV